jgi:hypothetical protein
LAGPLCVFPRAALLERRLPPPTCKEPQLMSRIRLLFVILASLTTLALTGTGTAAAAGTIVFDGSPGTGAPPATLGPYNMTPFGADPQPLGYVNGVAGPTGQLGFGSTLQHLVVGPYWQTWSHGYTGDVYWTLGGFSATLNLPPGTSAFYFYAEPNPWAVFTMTAVAQDGTTSGAVSVNGFAGAQYFGFYSTGSESIATINVTSNTDFAVGEFGISGASASHNNYIALGDSYSSGEGNPPFFAGTDGPSDYCHRSPQAYSEVLGAIYGSAPRFYACSGAVTSDITSTFHDTEPPQLTQPGADSTADLVTMTIGGNDAGFSDVLKACISQKLKADAFNAAIGAVGRWLGLDKDPSCVHSDSFVSSVNTRIDNIFWPVKTTYLQVLSAVDPVNTSVMVADYPHLFPASHDAQGCLSLSIILTNDDMDFMNVAGDRLDGLLRQAAGEAGVNFVDVSGTFAGHEICGEGGSYLNALSTASGNGGSCTWSVAGHCIIPGIPIVGSFHPNANGHAFGYASAFAASINAAVDRNSAGYPRNPVAWPDPPAITAIPAVAVDTLDAHPVTPGTADCADTYQAGQQVEVSGDGFVPSTAVQLYVTSPGLGDTGELQVGEETANADGHIATTVRIPLSATGFIQPGASAGMVFIDAIGLGSGADHQDDIAMIGLAPSTSSCGTVDQFEGFTPPVANPPAVNAVRAGQAVPVKFSVPGSHGTLDEILAAGYPQSAPVSCTDPEALTSGDPTTSVGEPSSEAGDDYHYNWKTNRGWSGCRELIVKLVDGSYHRAVFDFGG